jgi:hypothetical protein
MTAPTDTTKRETDPMTDKARELADRLVQTLYHEEALSEGVLLLSGVAVALTPQIAAALSAAREEGKREVAEVLYDLSRQFGYAPPKNLPTAEDIYGALSPEGSTEGGE